MRENTSSAAGQHNSAKGCEYSFDNTHVCSLTLPCSSVQLQLCYLFIVCSFWLTGLWYCESYPDPELLAKYEYFCAFPRDL